MCMHAGGTHNYGGHNVCLVLLEGGKLWGSRVLWGDFDKAMSVTPLGDLETEHS